ncbi:hypothetical protein [Polaribacter sp. L3A8]|uniref:hypothetical protein n=1 Tax=Polaribacter sp. L3A8 TaxID=2686361 RepID=UPI00131B5A66|nr:hypothetical protein [Polaribacter sp. L3A8]
MEEKIITGIIALTTSITVSIIAYLYALKKIKHEKREAFKLNHYERQVEAYLQFWCLLRPFTNFDYFNDTIIKEIEKKSFLNVKNSMTFYKDIRDFFYSKYGIFLSRKLKNPLFQLRTFILHKSKFTEENLIELSNEDLKTIKNYMREIRIIARNDIGVRDISLPIDELDLINE